MDDLSAAIGQFMSNPDNILKLQEVASSLGLGGDGLNPPRPFSETADSAPSSQWHAHQNAAMGNVPPHSYQQEYSRDEELSYIRSMLEQVLQNQHAGSPPQTGNDSNPNLSGLSSLLGGAAKQPPPAGNGGLDLSALSGILSGLGGAKGQSPDLSALSGLLGGLSGAPQTQSAPTGLSALTSMLGGDKAANPSLPGGAGGMDFGMLMKFQQAMSSISANAGNVKLLLGLKSHLNDPQRVSKVDDAIRVMQVIQFLPLLKESGLFGKMEDILNGVGLGGIGNVLGGLAGGR